MCFVNMSWVENVYSGIGAGVVGKGKTSNFNIDFDSLYLFKE